MRLMTDLLDMMIPGNKQVMGMMPQKGIINNNFHQNGMNKMGKDDYPEQGIS